MWHLISPVSSICVWMSHLCSISFSAFYLFIFVYCCLLTEYIPSSWWYEAINLNKALSFSLWKWHKCLVLINDHTYILAYILASACLHLFFAKPNLIVNTDLLIILGNYFSLICKAEILYPPQFYLKRSILIQDPWFIL